MLIGAYKKKQHENRESRGKLCIQRVKEKVLFNTFNSHFVEESNKKNGTYFTLNLNNLRMLNVFVSDV